MNPTSPRDSTLTALAVRLTPGQDLRAELQRITVEKDLRAACVLTCVGSLSRANLRLAGRSDPTLLEGDLEIISLVGTLSPDGPHLHVAVADSHGRTTAGHLLDGCTIRTTAEIVIARLNDLRFARSPDPATGYSELAISP